MRRRRRAPAISDAGPSPGASVSGGWAIGSNSDEPPESLGRRAAAISSAAPPIEWPNPTTPSSPPGSVRQVLDDGCGVVVVPVPVDVDTGRLRRVAVAAEVHSQDVERWRELLGQRQVGAAVEPGGMGHEQEWRPRRAGEVVHHDVERRQRSEPAASSGGRISVRRGGAWNDATTR